MIDLFVISSHFLDCTTSIKLLWAKKWDKATFFVNIRFYKKKEKTEIVDEIVHERGFLDLKSMKLNLPPEKDVRELTDL